MKRNRIDTFFCVLEEDELLTFDKRVVQVEYLGNGKFLCEVKDSE